MRTDLGADQRRGRIDDAVEDRLTPIFLLDVGNDAAVESRLREDRRDRGDCGCDSSSV